MVKQVKPLEYEEDGYTRVGEKKERVEHKPAVVHNTSNFNCDTAWCCCITPIMVIIILFVFFTSAMV